MCYADTLQVWFPAHCNPSWVDQTEVPDDLRQKWHEAQANRGMQFKVGTFKSSEIRMLTCTLKADWIQLPVENYLAMFPTLKQGVIAGVFMFLPNKQSMDDWCTAVYALPMVWPDVSMMGMNNMRKVVGYDFHYMRKKYRVPGMWGTVRPQWHSVEEREERPFTNRSNQPGDDMKDEVRTDDNRNAWRLCRAWNRFLLRLRQPGPPTEVS